MAREDTQFKPGNQFAKGRHPTGPSGRALALQRFDRFLTRPENLDLLEAAWVKALRTNPLAFWAKLVVPNIPKDMILRIGAEDPESIGRAIYSALVAMNDRERTSGGNGDGDGGNGDGEGPARSGV